MDRQARKLQTHREEVGAFGDEAAHEPSDDEEKEVGYCFQPKFPLTISLVFWDQVIENKFVSKLGMEKIKVLEIENGKI